MKKDKKNRDAAKRRQPVLRLVLIVLISIFLGFTVYSINAKRVLKNQLPMPFGVGAAVVLSGSMEPTLSVNDVILVRAAEDYQLDDIVVYQSGSDLVIHRVISIDAASLTTQGDANNTPDPPIDRTAIKGKLILAVPYAGLLVRGLQSPPGILIVLALAGLLLHLSWRKEKEAAVSGQEAIKDEIRRLKDELEQNRDPQAQTEPKPEEEQQSQI